MGGGGAVKVLSSQLLCFSIDNLSFLNFSSFAIYTLTRRISLLSGHSSEYCSVDVRLGDQGVYEFSTNSTGCHISTVQEPRDIYKREVSEGEEG